MKSDGIVRYENYKGYSAKGMKNNRTKKREVLRAIIRDAQREAKKEQQKKAYSKRAEPSRSNSYQ